MELSPGVIVGGNYRLESLVGSGGMGAVWKAADVTLGRTVAIKILHTNLLADGALNQRFQREARLLASIDHPAIVPVYAWLTIEDASGASYPCIVMPFVRGAPLGDTMRRYGVMKLEQAAVITRSLLEALSVAHAAGIVHRDLKPQNVILENRGGQTQVRLLDFGIAKALGAPASNASQQATQAGMLLGTPQYMSPEQIRDPASVDARADLWAAAVCFFEMLTGHIPFPGTTTVETISRVLAAQPLSVCAIDPQLPQPLDAFFARAFARDPAARPRTAEEMIAMLDALAVARAATVPFAWPPGAPGAVHTPPPSVPGAHAQHGQQPFPQAQHGQQPLPPAQHAQSQAQPAPQAQWASATAAPPIAGPAPAAYGRPESGMVHVGSQNYGALPVPAQDPGTAISGKRMASLALVGAAGLTFVGLVVLGALAVVVLLVVKC